jgi:hypothetical protein
LAPSGFRCQPGTPTHGPSRTSWATTSGCCTHRADNYLDASYPVKDGKIDSWEIDPRDNSLVDPTKYNDLMGYCGMTWVSDYMYRKVQAFLEKYPPGDRASAATSALLLVSGTGSGTGTSRQMEHARRWPWN